LVILEKGSLSAEQMEAELKDLVDEDWEWHVQKINDSDFAMFFPSKESLRMAIRGGGLTLPSNKLHVIVTNNSGDPSAAEQLGEVWVKLYDFPPPYRQAVRILLATRELGRPIAVDESSLSSSSEPIRLLLGYKPSTRLPPPCQSQIPCPLPQPPGPPIPKLVAMDRDRRGKHSFEELGGDAGWRREQDLRQKLGRE
jgi:hypothetical protein